jgi:hypothetical protein
MQQRVGDDAVTRARAQRQIYTANPANRTMLLNKLMYVS